MARRGMSRLGTRQQCEIAGAGRPSTRGSPAGLGPRRVDLSRRPGLQYLDRTAPFLWWSGRHPRKLGGRERVSEDTRPRTAPHADLATSWEDCSCCPRWRRTWGVSEGSQCGGRGSGLGRGAEFPSSLAPGGCTTQPCCGCSMLGKEIGPNLPHSCSASIKHQIQSRATLK